MQYIDYGLGVFEKTVFEGLPANEYRDLTEIYQGLLASGDLASYEVKERFYEIGSAQGIKELEEYLAAHTGRSDKAVGELPA